MPTPRQQIIEDAAIEALRNGWDVVDVLGTGRYYERLAKVYGKTTDGHFEDLDITCAQEKRLLADARRAVKEWAWIAK